MLDSSILSQVRELFLHLKCKYVFRCECNPRHGEAEAMREFITDFVSCSGNLACEFHDVAEDKLEFSLLKDGVSTGIKFRGIPNGHEFSSLILAVLNADGKGKNLPDEVTAGRIRALQGDISLQTYVSLTCTNCPDVVQSLNLVALLNPSISHEMVDGAVFSSEVEERGVQAVPAVYANGKLLHVGRATLGDILQKLEEEFGTSGIVVDSAPKKFDLLVLGGGPAGASAAIYSARKGLKVAVVAQSIGGQVKETVGIENLISVPYTTGEQLASDLRAHLEKYAVSLFDNRSITEAKLLGKEKVVKTNSGETFAAPLVIIATGASWRRLNVEGENEHIGRGVAFCPHCDGPFYKGKRVAVVGGGNSGIEAAIDLAGICQSVTVFEFMDVLKADDVLQRKARSLPNVTIFTSSQVTKVIGDGTKVTGLSVKDRVTEEMRDFELDGVFVQIGLMPNSKPFSEELDVTPAGEIIADKHCRTSASGVYAAGDVSNVPYKQIVIAMGEGAKAALSAFEDTMKAF